MRRLFVLCHAGKATESIQVPERAGIALLHVAKALLHTRPRDLVLSEEVVLDIRIAAVDGSPNMPDHACIETVTIFRCGSGRRSLRNFLPIARVPIPPRERIPSGQFVKPIVVRFE